MCDRLMKLITENSMVLGFDENEMHLCYGYDIPLSEFGKTVFLTREEAEQSLNYGGE